MNDTVLPCGRGREPRPCLEAGGSVVEPGRFVSGLTPAIRSSMMAALGRKKIPRYAAPMALELEEREMRRMGERALERIWASAAAEGGELP